MDIYLSKPLEKKMNSKYGRTPLFRELLDKGIKKLQKDPKLNTHRLSSSYLGLRGFNYSKLDIHFAYCKECRKRGDQEYVGCENCTTFDNETLHIIDADFRG